MPNATVEATTDDLRAALKSGEQSHVDATLLDLVASVASTADARAIAVARASIERLRSREQTGSDNDTKLTQAVASLGLALTRVRVAESDERNAREGGALAREVLAALDAPARPKDLIERTGADPAQIARALRKLEAAGDVVRVAGRSGDARERWYARNEPLPIATPAATPEPARTPTATDIKRRLREIAPIPALRARGYISDTTDPHVQALDVAKLYRVGHIYEDASFALAARRSQRSKPISGAQLAWIACVRQRGELIEVAEFDRDKLRALASDLPRRLRHGPSAVHELGGWLAACGVALVIEPGFDGGKLDGVAVVGANGQKIIGLSVRLDRFDSLVFTLLHELAHILNGDIDGPDEICIDVALGESPETSDREDAANALAGALLFPDGLDIPSKPTPQWVVRAASETGVHASLVIGHVQHKRKKWLFLKDNIPKVRDRFEEQWT
jgi:HTH-type transcriptional regulator/antitoxin HigA